MNGSARSWPLIATGGLMLATALLMSNPWFGAEREDWPWAVSEDAAVPLREAAVTGLWLLAGAWAVLLGIAGPRRPRAVGAVVLAALLLAECAVSEQGDVPFGFPRPLAPLLTALVFLGAGLWQARGGQLTTGARALAGVGGLLVVWCCAAPLQSVLNDESHFAGYARELAALPADWKGGFAPPIELWTHLVPLTLIFLAAGLGLLVGLGVRLPRTASLLFFLLVLGLALPGFFPADPSTGQMDTGASFLHRLLGGLLGLGVLPTLLGVFALVDLVRIGEPVPELEPDGEPVA